MATWTNKANLPAPLVAAVTNDTYDKVGDISVTGLIQPPRIRQLLIRHNDKVVEDVSDGIWRLIGSIGHAILERQAIVPYIAEHRMMTIVDDWIVSGQADLLSPTGVLDDYKFTSVWSVAYDKAEWESQLNSYAMLYRANGQMVREARIVAILRDWSKSRASREPDYPQVGVVVRPIRLWDDIDQENYVRERVKLHKEAGLLADNDLPECTDAERWARADTWAVKKKGNKRASRVLDTEHEAKGMLLEKGRDYEIEFRRGEQTVRCENYCSVRDFCSQYRRLTAVAK